MRVLIVGSGPTLYFLARHFETNGDSVVVICADAAEGEALAGRLRGTVAVGDGSDPAIQERAGARRADVVLALTPRDHDNLAVCQVAQRRFGVARTVAVVHDPDHAEVFRRLGVSLAVSATAVLARLLHDRAGLDDVAGLVPAAGGRVVISEVLLREGSRAVGRTLSEVGIPAGALVACLVRGEDAIVPRGDTRLLPEDRLLLVLRPDLNGACVAALVGDGR